MCRDWSYVRVGVKFQNFKKNYLCKKNNKILLYWKFTCGFYSQSVTNEIFSIEPNPTTERTYTK
jgi:hypothetical protein